MADRVLIMRGTTEQYGLPALMQTLGLGRQHMVLELFEAGQRVAAISVKAGQVLRVEPTTRDPRQILCEVLRSGRDWDFTVSRVADIAFEQPLGTVGDMLDAAADAAE